ncbi:hypothetical protein [Actinomycetospora chiangmaiensis]|uniref:hypothetical protein n=1 Tax=Actinomycetospora chiangmaiensis TaxID=402650 RepID=UPI000371EACD|nr:hypothetical protein [Actinomycetospora chiangmaiensis]
MRFLKAAVVVASAVVGFALCLGLGGLFAFGIITLSSQGLWFLFLGTVVIAAPVLGVLYLVIQALVLAGNPAAGIPLTIYSGAVLETSIHLITIHHHWPLWVAVVVGVLVTAFSVSQVLRLGDAGAAEVGHWPGRMH